MKLLQPATVTQRSISSWRKMAELEKLWWRKGKLFVEVATTIATNGIFFAKNGKKNSTWFWSTILAAFYFRLWQKICLEIRNKFPFLVMPFMEKNNEEPKSISISSSICFGNNAFAPPFVNISSSSTHHREEQPAYLLVILAIQISFFIPPFSARPSLLYIVFLLETPGTSTPGTSGKKSASRHWSTFLK